MSDLQGIKDILILISRLQVLAEGFDDLNKTSVLTIKIKVLLEISNYDKISPNKLKNKVGLAKSNLALLCNSLINDGYVTKQKDNFDNRSIFYQITPKGSEFLNKTLLQMKKNFEGELAYKNNQKQVEHTVKNLLNLID